jgi:hypothetical protein
MYSTFREEGRKPYVLVYIGGHNRESDLSARPICGLYPKASTAASALGLRAPLESASVIGGRLLFRVCASGPVLLIRGRSEKPGWAHPSREHPTGRRGLRRTIPAAAPMFRRLRKPHEAEGALGVYGCERQGEARNQSGIRLARSAETANTLWVGLSPGRLKGPLSTEMAWLPRPIRLFDMIVAFS